MSITLVKKLTEKAETKTGLKVKVRLSDKCYETGRKVASNLKETMWILFDDQLPAWNYVVVPTHL